MKVFNLVSETNKNLGTDFKSMAELLAYARIVSDRLQRQWIESDRKDFNIYLDPEYVYEGLICYHFVSKFVIYRTTKIWEQRNLQRGTLLDIYNGVGLTTIAMALNGFKVSAENENPSQVSFMQKSAMRHLGYEIPVVQSGKLTKRFDAVMSLEVIEHFKQPIPELKREIDAIKPDGMLILSTGFNNSEYPGHYSEYDINGTTVPIKEVTPHLHKVILKRFTMLWGGPKARPTICFPGPTGSIPGLSQTYSW